MWLREGTMMGLCYIKSYRRETVIIIGFNGRSTTPTRAFTSSVANVNLFGKATDMIVSE
jgi:hypothetical protein